jgi:hypothetical protein
MRRHAGTSRRVALAVLLAWRVAAACRVRPFLDLSHAARVEVAELAAVAGGAQLAVRGSVTINGAFGAAAAAGWGEVTGDCRDASFVEASLMVCAYTAAHSERPGGCPRDAESACVAVTPSAPEESAASFLIALAAPDESQDARLLVVSLHVGVLSQRPAGPGGGDSQSRFWRACGAVDESAAGYRDAIMLLSPAAASLSSRPRMVLRKGSWVDMYWLRRLWSVSKYVSLSTTVRSGWCVLTERAR